MKKAESREPLQELQVTLAEGVHFYDVQAYFLELANSFCIFSWFADQSKFSLVKKLLKSTQKQQIVTYVHGNLLVNGIVKPLVLREEKFLHQNEINYSWIEEQNQQPFKKKTDFRINLKIEVQFGVDRKTTQNLIKILFLNYRNSENTALTFPALCQQGKKTYGFRPNFCSISKAGDLVYPKLRQSYVLAQTKMQEKELILLLNQNNMKEMPFFQSLLQTLIKSGNKIPKIIGHPLNLLLVFLINEDKSFNEKIGKILLNYKNYEIKRTIKKNTNQDQIAERLSALLLKVMGQQNLLQPSFVQFFAQNLVNQEFEENFIQLVRLYYKILLDEDIQKEGIRTAIADNFYISLQEQVRNNTNNFTTLLKFIQFKHDLMVKDVLFAINKEIKSKTKKDISQFTLLDLYNCNQIQYTFIGFDINSQIVRFFNYQTAPNLPISAILSLIQILPLPFKSIIWKQEWGRYKININGKQRQISLSGHEIIDSKYILQCPLDLIQDPYLRRCYFSNNSHPQAKIQAVTPLKINVNEISFTDEAKKLLKSMKNNAIDSLPKIRLIWKILTTKNLVEIDLNNVETLYQIPILEKVLKINQTSKNYLKNLNLQVNQERIFHTPLIQYQMFKTEIQNIFYKSQELADFLQSKFINNVSIFRENKSTIELSQETKNIKKKLKLIKNLTYQDTIWFKSRIQSLIKGYDLKQKYVYKEIVQSFSKKLQSNRILFDLEFVKLQLMKILIKLGKSEMKVSQKEQENQVGGTNHRLNQTYTYIFDENEKNSLQSSLKQVKKFIVQLKNTVIQPYKYKNSLEFLNLQFQKLTYKVSKVIFKVMERKVQTKELQQMYSNFFQITPQLYNLKQIIHNKFYTHRLIKDFLLNNHNGMPIHMVIGGKDSSLLTQAHLLFNLRNIITQNEMKKITKITSSGFHSVLAFLFCLNLDKQTILQELIGLETLVKAKNYIKNQDNINIVQLLSRTVDIQEKLYYFQTGKKVAQIKIALLKKYNKLAKAFSEFQSTIEVGNQYKLIKFYSNIQEFDHFFANEDLNQKQLQILDYIQKQIEKTSQKQKLQEIVKENEQMLKQKILLNRIGIKFTIKFLYRDTISDLNWENIHKAQYQQLFLYKTHLVNLMKKYNVSPDVRLIDFNQTNYQKIKLCFAFINQTDFKYEFITQDSQPHLKLLDLLITSATLPVYFGAYPLTTKDLRNTKYLQKLISKVQGKFAPNNPQKRFWSCGMFNPIPFNIIQAEYNSEVVLSFTTFSNMQDKTQIRSIPEIRFTKIVSQKQIQSRNFKALDLISFWWTKPKKLTPELKQLMFGNIYQSPFSRLYFFIQNSSYQHLLCKAEQRSTVCLNIQSQHILKSQIIKDAINRTVKSAQSIYFFKIMHQKEQKEQKTIIQCIKSSQIQQNWLYLNGMELKQLKNVTLNQKRQYLQFSFYKIQNNNLELITLRVILSQFFEQNTFLELIISKNNDISFKKIDIQYGKFIKNQIAWDKQYKKWQFQQCRKCGEPFKNKEKQKDSHCSLCAKKKQFKLCLLIDYQLNEFIEPEPQIFESAPIVKLEKRSSFSRYLCCFSCFRSK